MSLNDSIITRQSLLIRLSKLGDQKDWEVFFETYWRLIYNAAVKAGLPDAEAQDVVQETIISVWKSIPKFKYDAAAGSFKSWLMHLTQWRISDQLRKRQRRVEQRRPKTATSTETGTIDRVPDPATPALEAAWDQEWETNLLEAATDRVKKTVDPKQYQAFDLYVCKEWPVSRVARALKISSGMVYLAKHRVGRLIKKELAHLHARPVG